MIYCNLKKCSHICLQALHQFYQDASSQQEINRWLTAAQISPQAWNFSWKLLDKEKVRINILILYEFLFVLLDTDNMMRHPDEIVHELPLPLNAIHELPWTSMTLKCNVSLEGLHNLIILAMIFHGLPCLNLAIKVHVFPSPK